MYATKGAPSECQQHWPEYEGRDCLTDCDTTNLPKGQYHGKVVPCVIYVNVNKLQFDIFLKKVPKPYTYTDYFKWHEHDLTSTLLFCPQDVHAKIELFTIKSLS